MNPKILIVTYNTNMFSHLGNETSTNVSAVAVDASAAIGGGIGGAVFLILLIIAMCILLWCMIKYYKKKKTKYFGDRVYFSRTLQDSTLSYNPRYLLNIKEVDSDVEARICKCLIYDN